MVVPLAAKPRNPGGIQSGKHMCRVELERTTPGENVEIADGDSGVEGAAHVCGRVGEKTFDTDVLTPRRELHRPLKCERGHTDCVGVGVTDSDPESPRRRHVEDTSFAREKLMPRVVHRTRIVHAVQCCLAVRGKGSRFWPISRGKNRHRESSSR